MNRNKYLHNYALKCADVLKVNFRVKKVYIIGSVANHTANEYSDIDIAVEGLKDSDYIRALTMLYETVPSDLEINLIPLENAFESLRQKAKKDGELIYG
jgi:predicted nucleotidyltransferase